MCERDRERRRENKRERERVREREAEMHRPEIQRQNGSTFTALTNFADHTSTIQPLCVSLPIVHNDLSS